jgi:hypothetical protein
MVGFFAILLQDFKSIVGHGYLKERTLRLKLQLVRGNNHQQFKNLL